MIKIKQPTELVILRLKNLVSLTVDGNVRSYADHVKDVVDYVLKTARWTKQELVETIESLSPSSKR